MEPQTSEGRQVCAHCNSTEVEPVEMENPAINYEDDKQGNQVMIRKHQVGVAFWMVDGNYVSREMELKEYLKYIDAKEFKKFLPIRQKVYGDNSVLMVVKV